MSSLWHRIRQRKVVQWVLAYLAGAWLVLQIVDVFSEFWGWSPVVGRVVTIVACAGLVAAGVVAWYHGERGRQRITGVEILILAGLAVVATALLPVVVKGPTGPDGTSEESGSPPSLAAPVTDDTRPSIAVLPFADLSATGDQQYFGDGVAEEILNALAKVPGLRVAARTSAFALRDADIATVVQRLGVGTVLEGSVRREAGTVRVNAQLINGRSGFHLWSEQYDRSLESVIAIQEDIARSVVRELRVQLAPGNRGLVSAGRTDPEAYDQYLLGRSDWNARIDGFEQAIDHFRTALSIDPTFASAYSGLADTYVLLFEYNRMPPEEALLLARTAAERALELDPGLAEAHASLAEVLAAERRWSEAEHQFRRAIELNPGYLTAHHWYGWLLAHLARHDEAIRYLRGAKALDPLSPIVRRDLAGAYHHARRFQEAIDEADECLAARLHPTCAGVGFVRDRALLALGRAPDVLAGGPTAPPARVMGLAAVGRGEEARDVLERYEADPKAAGHERTNPITHLHLAEMYVAIGDREKALEAVERAEALGFATGPILLREWPHFDSIRGHPRFRRVLERIGYPPRERP